MRRWLALCLLAAIGGCGGGGSGTGSADEVTGSISGAASDGGYRVLQNRAVELVAVDAQGAVLSVTGRSTSDTNGRYRLPIPAGQSRGTRLVVQTTTDEGVRLRAFVLDQDIEVNPGSEAFVQSLLAATAPVVAGVQEAPPRMARLQSGVTLFLSLIPGREVTDSGRVAELKSWLARDPASIEALDALGRTGQLPASLRDLGGLFGIGTGAWESRDDAYGARQYVTRASPSDARDQYTYDITAPLSTGGALGVTTIPLSRVRVQDDGFTIVEDYIPASGIDATTRAFNQLFAPARQVRFGQPVGQTGRVSYAPTKTADISFDGDNLPDDLTRTVEATPTGVELINAFGTAVKALRVSTVTTLAIELSGGGQVRVIERRTDWCVPFAGVVRSVRVIEFTDASGRVQTFAPRTIELTKGVLNDVSWPGRVWLKQLPFEMPTDISSLSALGAVAGGQGVLFADSASLDPSATTMLVVDSQTGAIRARQAVPQGPAVVQLHLAADGSKVHVIRSAPSQDSYLLRSVPVAQAQLEGALIARFDAATLTLENTLILPPRASLLASDRAFSRASIRRVLVSPNAGTSQLVIETQVDTLLLDGNQILPATLQWPGGESMFLGEATLSRTILYPNFWDGDRNEIHLSTAGFSGEAELKIVPAKANGLDLAQSRQAPQFLLNRNGVRTTWNDRVSGNVKYANNLTLAFDVRTGELLGTAAFSDSGASSPYQTPCQLVPLHMLCVRGSTLQFLDRTTLQLVQTLDLNTALRRVSGSTLGPGSPHVIVVGPGQLALVSLSGFTRKTIIYRVSY